MFLQVLDSSSHQSSRLNTRSFKLRVDRVSLHSSFFFLHIFTKMLSNKTYLCLLITINAFAHGDTSKKTQRDSSLIQLLDKHYTSVHSPRTYGFSGNYKSNKYSYQQSPYYYSSDNMSGNVSLYPDESKSSIGKATSVNTGEVSKHPNYYDYWRPTFALLRQTYGNKSVGYSKPQSNALRDPQNGSYSWTNEDSLDGSHSIFHYQRIRPSINTQSSVKNSLLYYTPGQTPMKGVETIGKLKHKKTVYPRLHKPYAMNKYPITKTVYPSYRRYYQSSPQRYPAPSNGILRYGTQTQKPTEYYDLHGYHATSHGTGATSPTLSTYRYPTTERMDDSYANDTGASEDYFSYNDTISSGDTGYDEAEHDTDDSTPDSYGSNLDENTTRGYYGDRVYMSAQMPIKSWNYLNPKNRYYIVRKTSRDDDDDFETLFE